MYDYYKILNIPRFSDIATIRKAYRTQALKWHPDRNKEDSKAKRMMQLINMAYDVLLKQKVSYDSKLRQRMNPGQTIIVTSSYGTGSSDNSTTGTTFYWRSI